MYNKIHSLLCILIVFSSCSYAMDNPHFYRATNMFLEPRIEHDFLSTMDATIGHGSTSKSRNATGAIVPLFDLYGTHPLPADLVQKTHFNTLSIDGTFKIREANVFYVQNFLKGFFLLCNLPVRTLEIKDINFTDLSSFDSPVHHTSEEWRSFMADFNTALASHHLSAQPFEETGAGDFTTWLGWAHNYQNTTVLDFIDITLATGMLAPTGKKRNENQLFSLPLGYNGHWAIPLSVKLSLGMYEWITLGMSLDTLFFIKNNQTMRIKTDPTQSNIIKLDAEHVTVKKGTVWDAGVFLKADHFIYGLSLAVAYSCAGEQKTTLHSLGENFLDQKIVNDDSQLKNWYMHTIHFGAEYDFAKQDSKIGPRIGFFYNHQIGGIRVFDTNMIGGSFGLDIGWDM